MSTSFMFLISFLLLSFFSIFYTISHFEEAFPVINLQISFSRQDALIKAKELISENRWRLFDREFMQAASFETDETVKYFLELECGHQVFTDLLSDTTSWYTPYFWKTRAFAEGEISEVMIAFKPNGHLYAFAQKIPETEAGPTLNASTAQTLAEQTLALHPWNLDLNLQHSLVETKSETYLSGRTAHTLVYERNNVTFGSEGKMRVKVVVDGEVIREVTHFVKVPEAFSRKYEEMRAANIMLAFVAMMGALVFGMSALGAWGKLTADRWILSRPAFGVGFTLAFLLALNALGKLPLTWMKYDTSIPVSTFLAQFVLAAVVSLILLGILLGIILSASEGLTRKAFPTHIQLWKLLKMEVASSSDILFQTVIGYGCVPIFLAFDIFLYSISRKYLGWWVPSSLLFEPNILASYWPFLSAVSLSFQAGLLEEALFRAVPIAGSLFIGRYFNKEKLFFMIGFVLQVLVFSAAHANYPTFPAYARLVELILPSTGFGLIYVCFGLYPCVLLHYIFDLVWFSLPLFVSTSEGIRIQQVLVIFCATLPLFVILFSCIALRKLPSTINPQDLNQSFTPPQTSQPKSSEETNPVNLETVDKELSSRIVLTLSGMALGILFIFGSSSKFSSPPLTIDRLGAIELAELTLQDQFKAEFNLSEWTVLTGIHDQIQIEDHFVWKEAGAEVYRDIISHSEPVLLRPPCFWVRFCKFEGDLIQRSEEFHVFIIQNGFVLRIMHGLPESQPGANLTKEEAQKYATEILMWDRYLVDLNTRKNITEISAEQIQHPNRVDWEFQFNFTSSQIYPLSTGEARFYVQLVGDDFGDAYSYIYVPEEWKRKFIQENAIPSIIQTVCLVLVTLLLIVNHAKALLAAFRVNFPIDLFKRVFLMSFLLTTIYSFNNWPNASIKFSTATPLQQQIFKSSALKLASIIATSVLFALLLAHLQARKLKKGLLIFKESPILDIVLGIGLGVLLHFAGWILSQLFPSSVPQWSSIYSYANAFFPSVNFIIGAVFGYVSMTLFVLCVFVYIEDSILNRTKPLQDQKFRIFFVLFFVSFILNGAQGVSTLHDWIQISLTSALMISAFYWFILHHNLELIPLMTLGNFILDLLRETQHAAIPEAGLGINTFVCLITLSNIAITWWSLLLLQSDSQSPSKTKNE